MKSIMLHAQKLLGLRTALADLAVNHPERILLRCSVCGGIYTARDMQIRKKPGKWQYYFGKRCKGCV